VNSVALWIISKKHWALWAAMGMFLALTAVLLTLSLRANEGSLVYGLDDAYIHMAIAKNFAQYGVWGVTPDGFTSATSSPAWTLLLSLTYLIFGVNDVAPLILNILCALAILILVNRAFADSPAWYRLLVMLMLIFCTPFMFLVFIGMEHLLHTLVVLALVLQIQKKIQLNHRNAEDTEKSEVKTAFIIFLAACATFVRYEGMFLIMPLCVLLMWRGQWKLALPMAVAAALPIIIYGAISLANGWNFVPNSLLIKSVGTFYVEGDPFNYWLFSVFVTLAREPQLLVMLTVAALLLIVTKVQRGMLSVFIVALLLHARLGGVGVQYRYEAYLVALGIVLFARVLLDHIIALVGAIRRMTPTFTLPEKKWGVRFLLAALILYAVLPLLRRAVESLQNAIPATQNIHQQQYQMGMFLREYYDDQTVVLNDIGAASYFADIHLIDALGLANMDIARARQTGEYSRERIAEIGANAEIAIVYTTWFPQGLPESWRAVGSWQVVANKIVLGDMTVTFYAVNPAAEADLAAHLVEFSPRLPENVVESGRYTEFVGLAEILDLLPPPIYLDDGDLVNSYDQRFEDYVEAVAPSSLEDTDPATIVVLGLDTSAPSGFAPYNAYRFTFDGNPVGLDIYLRHPQEFADIATFGSDIRLRAWRLRTDDGDDDPTVLPCERVILESWWQNLNPITLDYSLTLSIFGDAAGIIFTDRAPPTATTLWQTRNLYPDVRALDIPCDMPRGEYPLTLGIHSADGQFLPVDDESFFVLTTLSVQ
jgi:hypothetical protein